MNEESDGNFEWTDTSEDNDSECTDTMMAVDKSVNNHSDEDSESGKSFKIKLHKQLFTDDTPNGLSDCDSSKKLKKRKLTNNSDVTSPLKKHIKHEPESDIEITKKNYNHESDTQMDVNEHYLNVKVKEEISSLISNSKKEKKKKKESKCITVDMSTAEETIVEERQHKKQKKKLNTKSVTEATAEEDETDCKSNQKSFELSERIMFEDDTFIEAEVKNSKTDHRQSYTDSFNLAIDKNNDNTTTSLNIKKIITANPHLKPIKPIKLESNCHITKNDDVWILDFPKDFDVSSLENKNIIIDKRSKLKIKGQTYTGVLNEDINRLPVYSMSKNKHLLYNVPVKGRINFQRKIPKVNFIKFDMVRSEPHFTQITEITRRHPLFGAHYKHDIKISKEVAEKLKPVHIKEYSETVSTRKSSKKKDSIEKNNQNFDTFLEIKKSDPNEEIKTKKKKRKYKIDENQGEPPTKKAKKCKHNPNTAEAWESEKAIVENLFNF